MSQLKESVFSPFGGNKMVRSRRESKALAEENMPEEDGSQCRVSSFESSKYERIDGISMREVWEMIPYPCLFRKRFFHRDKISGRGAPDIHLTGGQVNQRRAGLRSLLIKGRRGL